MPSTKKKGAQAPRKSSPHSAKEQKQNRVIIIGFIITAVIIVGMIAYALLYDSVLKNYIAVAKVDNVKVDNKYFDQRVRLERYSYVQQYNMLYSQYQMFASMEEYADYADYYINQMQQVQAALDDNEGFGEYVLDEIIDDQVIANKADELGVDVTDDEIDTLMTELFNFYPEGTPTPAPTSTPYTTPTVSAEQEAMLGYTPTPEVEPTEVIDEAEEEPVAEESDVEATEEAATDEETVDEVVEETGEETEEASDLTATATVVPTATPYTEELYQQELTNYIGELESIGVEEKYFRKYVYFYLLKQKAQEKIYADVPVEQDQVWARHILVETEEEAQEVLTRLDEGEDWNVIAAEVSLDTSNSANGGDLGWFNIGYMVEPFEEAAFALEVGEISDPVETDFGWHIIQIIGHEVRPLSSSDYEYAQQAAYGEWFTAAKEEANIEINKVWKDLVPDKPSLTDEIVAE